VIVGEAVLDLKDVDLGKWSAWLSAAGYADPAGWRKIAAAVHAKLPDMSAPQIASCVGALYDVGLYDRALFTDVAKVVKARFTEFETEGLAKLIAAFAENEHYDADLFDDVADSIAYCNHFFAPMELSQGELAGVFAAYAKFKHDRADMFVPLARAVNDDKLAALPDAQLGPTVMKLLRAFDAFGFFPEATEGLFVLATVKRAAAFSPADKADVEAMVKKVEGFVGAPLAWYRGGYADPAHFHGAPFTNYNLWALRDELTAETYKPSDFRAWKKH